MNTNKADLTAPVPSEGAKTAPIPCPFCRGAAKDVYVRDGRQIRCIKCGAAGPSEFHGPANGLSATERAIAAWNRRTESAALSATNAALLNALKEISELENRDFGPDWAEIEDARLIARAAIEAAA